MPTPLELPFDPITLTMLAMFAVLAAGPRPVPPHALGLKQLVDPFAAGAATA